LKNSAKFHPRRIIIGMDDLDEVKGSVLKLQAYDRFLTNHAEWKDKVVLFQVLLSFFPQHWSFVLVTPTSADFFWVIPVQM
jgi:trehalose-6-phosphate synthase